MTEDYETLIEVVNSLTSNLIWYAAAAYDDHDISALSDADSYMEVQDVLCSGLSAELDLYEVLAGILDDSTRTDT